MKDKPLIIKKTPTKVVKIETVPAIRIAYNDSHFYLTAIPGKVLFA